MQIFSLIRMVLWSFFGIRRGAAHEADVATANLPLLPFVAVVLAILFCDFLFALVKVALLVAH